MQRVRNLMITTAVITVVSAAYFSYATLAYPPIPENETLLSEIGEGFGEAGLYALVFIYARTLLKLALGTGPMARRLLPDHAPVLRLPALAPLLGWLDRTHPYVGIATVAVILLHIGLMGVPVQILFFPAVLALVIWQGLFGLFLQWRYAPRELRKFSYFVHAQLVTGVMIGVFAWFGHLLIED